MLFSGTLRVNLDPMEEYLDADVWRALELANLKTYVSSLNHGLQHEVIEGGVNFRYLFSIHTWDFSLAERSLHGILVRVL